MSNKAVHISFWIIISCMLSVLLYLYSPTQILLAIIPLTTATIQIIVAEKVIGKNKYYPTSLTGYILLNLFFFLLFILTLFFINDHTVIKIGLFIVMTLIGFYTSFFLLSKRKKEILKVWPYGSIIKLDKYGILLFSKSTWSLATEYS